MPNVWTQNLQVIAREALPMLVEEMVVGNPNIINRNYKNAYEDRGNVIQIKKPAVYEGKIFDGTSVPIDVQEKSVSVVLDSIVEVPLAIGSAEATYNIEDAMEQLVRPSMTGLAEKISHVILQKAACGIPYFYGTPGVTPSNLKDYALARKILRDNKAPLAGKFKSVILDPSAEAEALVLDKLTQIDAQGYSATLRDAVIGRVLGFNFYADQGIPTIISGDFSALTDVTVTGVIDLLDPYTKVVIGSTVTLKSAAGLSTDPLAAGDLLLINGKSYIITDATNSAVAGELTAQIYPNMPSTEIGQAVTFVDQTERAHVSNLMFLKNAIGLVNRPLATLVAGQGPGGMYTAMSETLNFSVRVAQTYNNITKKFSLTFDTLIGAKVYYPELGVQVLG